MAHQNYKKQIEKVPSAEKTEQGQRSFESMYDDWYKYCSYWRQYPDRFIDFITPADSKIRLYPYQRLFLRVLFRYQEVFITATRGTAKSFTSILANFLKCVMYPGTSLFICAPGKEQAAKISQENLDKIFEYFPLLAGEIAYKSFTNDYTKLVFKNGSRFDVVQVRDSARGGRRNGGSIEEVADEHMDGDVLNSVVIPLMANNRIAACGGYDPDECHKFQYYITTAGTKQSFAYQRMREINQKMVEGKSAFNLGAGYELACMYGQLDIEFITEKKEQPSFNPLAFAREYESIWTGSSEDSLVQVEDFTQCRVLHVAEDKADEKDMEKNNAEYVLSYDVARAEGSSNASCALCVLKIVPKGDGTYHKNLVNIYSFEGTHFNEQARFLKQKVVDFKASALVVDTNGLGVGLVDQLVLAIDENPPYSVLNDDRYSRYKTDESIPMVYAVKSQSKEMKASDIHNVFMQVVTNHKIKMLKSESSVKADLAKKKSKATGEEIAKAIRPYTMTDLLQEEVMNLEYKQSGNQTQVKQISKGINKDKFSALEYGLWYIHTLEKKNSVRKNESFDISQMFLFKKPVIRKF